MGNLGGGRPGRLGLCSLGGEPEKGLGDHTIGAVQYLEQAREDSFHPALGSECLIDCGRNAEAGSPLLDPGLDLLAVGLPQAADRVDLRWVHAE